MSVSVRTNRHFLKMVCDGVFIRAVPNRGLTLFGRIRIVVPTIRPNTNTNSY